MACDTPKEKPISFTVPHPAEPAAPAERAGGCRNGCANCPCRNGKKRHEVAD